MLKKIVLGGMAVGIVAVLIIGALNRTTARNGSHQALGGGRGQGARIEESGFATRGGRAAGYGQGAGRAARDGQGGYGQASVNEWLTVQGTVLSVDAETLVVATNDGREVIVEGQPWRYAQAQGFRAAAGDQVTMVGFNEDGEFKAARLSDQSNGAQVTLRDESGRPGWAGQGRRSA